MNHTKQFIEDAVAGGWRGDLRHVGFELQDSKYSEICAVIEHIEHGDVKKCWFTISQVLLDPTAWQTVGKTRGWDEMHDYPDRVYEAWDTFFYELYNSKTIEEALAAISE